MGWRENRQRRPKKGAQWWVGATRTKKGGPVVGWPEKKRQPRLKEGGPGWVGVQKPQRRPKKRGPSGGLACKNGNVDLKKGAQ